MTQRDIAAILIVGALVVAISGHKGWEFFLLLGVILA